MRRYSAYAITRKNTQWGGTYADSRVFSTAFRRGDIPLNLGVKDVEIFSKQVNGKLLNKPMTFRTGKNIVELSAMNGGKVQWSLGTTGTPRARIVDVDPNLGTAPGQAGTKFRIALNVGFYHEPILLKTRTTNAPRLRILGYPTMESTEKYWYEVELQTGSATDFCPVGDLQIGEEVRDNSTSIAMELNGKQGGIEFGSTSDFGSHISYFGRKFEVSDRAILRELDAMKGKGKFEGVNVGGTFLGSIVGSGYVIANAGLTTEKAIQEGQFLTNIEMLVRDRVFMDRENDMTHGKLQVSNDADTSYPRLNASGWHEYSKEGNYRTHDGTNITLRQIVNGISALKFNVDDPKGDVVEIESGSSGMMLFSILTGLEVGALPFTLSSSYFMGEAASNFTNNGLWAGHQFVEYNYMGRTFKMVWNPNQDNLDIYPDYDPETGRPLESESLNVYSLGTVNDGLGNKGNMALAHEPISYAWWTQSGVCNFSTGNLQAGEKSYGGNVREAGVHMEINGAGVCFDISRTYRAERVA